MIIDLNNNESFEILENKFTLVDGSFDPLHHGHIAYFLEALKLELPVVCLIAPDDYTVSKHPVLIPQKFRAEIIQSIKYITHVVLGDVETSLALRLLKPNIYFKGADWENKLPLDIVDACREIKCQIIYGPKPIESSSRLLRNLETYESKK